ncbi:MAG: transposase [Victivallales bacterium]|nr:transposase [Victivallales bacterium]
MKNSTFPVAGTDYPRTYQEFLKWFSDESACRRYLAQCRWPTGFECPLCATRDAPWITARGYLHCRKCESEGVAVRRRRSSPLSLSETASPGMPRRPMAHC